MDEQRQRLIDSLREFAAFLEFNANAPMPCVPRFDVFCLNKEEFQSAVKSVGGRLEKRHEYGDLMCVRRHFSVVEYDINVNREQICERVVVGTKVVPEQAAVPEHEEDVVEWRCHPILEVTT